MDGIIYRCTYADLYPNIWYDLIVHDYLNKYKVTTLKGGENIRTISTASTKTTEFLSFNL